MPALSSGEKKFAIIASVIAVVFVAVVGGTVAALTIGHDKPVPVVQVAHGDSLTRVSPKMYCHKINGPTCEGLVQGEMTTISLPPGESMMVTVPKEVADQPWILIVVRRNDTPETNNQKVYAPGSRYTVTLTSEPSDPILGIEIQRVPFRTDDGYFASGIWSLKTTP